MTIVDWRELGAAEVAPLYAEQTRAWMDALGWDLSGSWAVVERARVAGALPGMVSRRANGSMAGWTFFLRQDEVLQIGALAGSGAGPVRGLLEAILDSPEAAAARELTCLLYPPRACALSALRRRRFLLQPQRYVARSLAGWPGPSAAPQLSDPFVARLWTEDDAVGCVRLLARAYASRGAGRALAPHGTLTEWAQHLGQIVHTPACGTLMRRACFLVEERTTRAPAGFVLTTAIGPGTAHVAQLAVDPAWTRRGIGRSLVHLAARAAGSGGANRITLLMPDDNEAASRLSAAEGFEESGQIVFASRSMPVKRQVQPRRAA